MFDHKHYVPVIVWRQGEYQALMRSTLGVKSEITPLINVPPIEWDFEDGCLSKTLDVHLDKFARRVDDKWGKEPCFVDIHLVDEPRVMGDESHAVEKIFSDMRDRNLHAIPVIHPSSDDETKAATRAVVAADRQGLAVRISLAELASGIDNKLEEVLDTLGDVSIDETDIILDLGTPNFHPLDDLANLLWNLIDGSEQIKIARTFTVVATSFPESMGSLTKYTQSVSRDEWLLYKRLVALANDGRRIPTFGDYSIAHPNIPRIDMRIVKPSATLRYTVDDAWVILKGDNVRDHGFQQYAEMCQNMKSDDDFMGDDYSYGDDYINKCGAGTASTGNLTTWRCVGTNHHFAKVVDDISNFFGA